MHRNVCYKLLCDYCAYRISYDGMCGLRDCKNCDNTDKNYMCQCCKDKAENETTCPYFRYLAR